MIKATAERIDGNPYMNDMPVNSTHYSVTLTNTKTGRSEAFFYSQGPAHKDCPTAREVLECLISDASCAEYDFVEFCETFGYEIKDLRKAERTFKAIGNNSKRLADLLGGIPEGDPEDLARALTEE